MAHMGIEVGNPKEKDHLENIAGNNHIRILSFRSPLEVWTGLMWLGRGTVGSLFWIL